MHSSSNNTLRLSDTEKRYTLRILRGFFCCFVRFVCLFLLFNRPPPTLPNRKTKGFGFKSNCSLHNALGYISLHKCPIYKLYYMNFFKKKKITSRIAQQILYTLFPSLSLLRFSSLKGPEHERDAGQWQQRETSVLKEDPKHRYQAISLLAYQQRVILMPSLWISPLTSKDSMSI